jgi:hypothetical protein
MQPCFQQDRRGRVPKIVNPNSRQPGSVQRDLQCVGDGAGLRRLTVPVRKDELALGPEPLLLQRGDRELRELDATPAGDRLRLDEDQATAALALECSSYLYAAGDQVDIAPLEPQGPRSEVLSCRAAPRAGTTASPGWSRTGPPVGDREI